MEKPCFEVFKERAEDLAFETKPKVYNAISMLAQDVGKSDITHVGIHLLAKVVHDQTGVPLVNIKYEMLRARMAHEKGVGDTQPTGLLMFLTDESVCRLGDWKSHYTPRPKFFDAYHSWCARKGINPTGKHAFYRDIGHQAVLDLGVRHGANGQGAAVVRGVRMAEDDDEL